MRLRATRIPACMTSRDDHMVGPRGDWAPTTSCFCVLAMLESLLAIGGRENLVIVGVEPIRRLLTARAEAGKSIDDVCPLVARALAELTRCAIDDSRSPDVSVFDRIAAVASSAEPDGGLGGAR